MAFTVSNTKMCIGYNNRLVPENIASITLTNIASDAVANNVGIEDPTIKLATAATTAAANVRTVIINFSAAWQISCFGLANHDLITGGYDYIDVAYWNGSSYTQAGGTTQSFAGVLGDPNFLLRFPPAIATISAGGGGQPPLNTYSWRIIFSKNSGTNAAFSIGLFFLGLYYEVAMNPEEGGVFIPTEIELEPTPTLGGISYKRPGPARASESAEINWKRIPQSMMDVLRGTIEQNNRKKPIAIIWPEQVSYAMPNATQHFYGNISRMTPSPRTALTPPHKYDLTIAMRGIL